MRIAAIPAEHRLPGNPYITTSLDSYVRTTIRNRCLSYVESATSKRHKPGWMVGIPDTEEDTGMQIPCPAPSPEELTETNQLTTRLKQAVHLLPAAEQIVLTLWFGLNGQAPTQYLRRIGKEACIREDEVLAYLQRGLDLCKAQLA